MKLLYIHTIPVKAILFGSYRQLHKIPPYLEASPVVTF